MNNLFETESSAVENIMDWLGIGELTLISDNSIKILKYIYQNYSDNQLCVYEICKKLKICKTQLYFYLDIELKMTLMQIVLLMRMNKCIELMQNSNDEIKNIKRKCGYLNSKTFYMNVKKVFNTTPLKLKNEINCEINCENNILKYKSLMIKNILKSEEFTILNYQTKRVLHNIE